MKEIKLTKGKVAFIDDEDYNYLAQWKWRASLKGRVWYAVRTTGKKENRETASVKMHREIMNNPTGMDIDHLNSNGLDNRKINLRVCTRSQNLRNMRPHKDGSSKYKGVCWKKREGKWYARIYWKTKDISLGLFVHEVEAAKAYDEKAAKLFGEFARLNFPEEE